METCLIVFAKNPVPNQVKTRLIPKITAEQAASLYSAFLTDWVATLKTLTDVELVIAYTPPGSKSEIERVAGDDVTYIQQTGDDLGERLTSATKWAAERGYDKVIIVGSDSPTLPISFISNAIEGLETRDVVIGPSLDGGYYLIGFNVNTLYKTVPIIFNGIAWSTAHTLKQTIDRIQHIKVSLKLLPPWYDVDTPEDLVFLQTHLTSIRYAEGITQARTTEQIISKMIKEDTLWEN